MSKVVLVYGSGGHGEQARRLVEYLSAMHKEVEVVAHVCELDAKEVSEGEILRLPRMMVYGKKNSIFPVAGKSLNSFIRAMIFLGRHKPDVVVSTGPAFSIPVMYASKLIGAKNVYIESWSRFETMSRSAKLSRPVVNTYVVQNKSLARTLGAPYVGRL